MKFRGIILSGLLFVLLFLTCFVSANSIDFSSNTIENNSQLTYGIDNSAFVNITTSILGEQYVVNNFDNSLVGWYRFNNFSSAIDSVNGNNGTASGSVDTTADGKFGRAGIFDGTGTVNIPSVSISGDISVSAWIYYSNAGQSGGIVEKSPFNTEWELFLESGGLKWRGGSEIVVSCTAPSANTWHHVVATQSGTDAVIYIDGTLCNSGSVTAIGNDANSLYIGSLDSIYLFNGKIDEVSIWNKSLSAGEVETLNNSAELTGTEDGLVSLYHMNEEIWNGGHDSSSHGNNAVNSGATWVSEGKFGNAFSFDGADDYIESSNNVGISGSQARTISVWVKTTGSARTGIVGWGWESNQAFVLAHSVFTSGKLYFIGWGNDLPSDFTINDDVWHQIVATYNGTTLILYGDGEVVASGEKTLSTTDSKLYIGNPDRDGLNFSGSIDDVLIFNRSLSAQEIKALYNATYSRYTANDGLVGWWTGDDNMLDSSGYGNNGVNNGSTFAKGKLFDGFNFDGTGKYVEIPSQSYFSADGAALSISFWASVPINAPSVTNGIAGNDGAYIITKSGDLGSNYDWGIENDGNSKICFDYWSAGNTYECTNFAINDGMFHYYTAIFDDVNGNYSFYIDGSRVMNGTNSGSAMAVNASVLIGSRREKDSSHSFTGTIDDLMIFNRTLSDSEISELASQYDNRYAHNFTNLAIGSHSFQTFAVNSSGSLFSSEQRTITVQPPHIAFIYPTLDNGELTTSNNVYVNVSSNTNVASVLMNWNNSLVGWYRGEENANDELGVNNATAYGTSYTSGILGNAFSFDGVDDYIESSNNVGISGSQARTISAWIKNNDALEAWPGIIGWGTTLPNQRFTISTNGGNWSMNLYSSAFYSNVPVDEGVWQYHSVVYNGTDFFWYINSNLVASGQGDGGPINTVDSPLSIGRLTGEPTYLFNGLIDDVQIYSRALSVDEIKSIYNATENQYYNNFTDLADGNYDYIAYGQDSTGTVFPTEQRTVTVAFEAGAGVSCGETITSSMVLTGDLDCSDYEGNALNIGAEDIIIDCQGNSIIGSGGDSGYYGIYGVDYSGVTVKNCVFNEHYNGIYAYYMSGWTVENNTFIIPSDGYGLYFEEASSNNIILNTFNGTGDYGGDSGVYIDYDDEGSFYNNISYNNFNYLGYGVYLDSYSDYNYIMYNNFTSNDYGFYLDYADHNQIGHNLANNTRSSTMDSFSCPFLYSWNGTSYNFVSDLSGRGTLGIPQGTGYKKPYPDGYAKISSNELREQNGNYSLQITQEYNEIPFIDYVQIMSVDHSSDVDIYPGFGLANATKIYSVSKNLTLPVSCTTDKGSDCLPTISTLDENYTSQNTSLELDLGDLSEKQNVKLVINKIINVSFIAKGAMKLYVKDSNGSWVSAFSDPNDLTSASTTPMTYVLDLTGKFLTNDYRIKMSFPTYLFDYIAIDTSPEEEMQINNLNLMSANLHHRGYSKLSNSLTHEYNYNDLQVINYPQASGNFTKYGEVVSLLSSVDNKFTILNHGDEITLNFEKTNLENEERDFIIHTNVLYKPYWRANGTTVEPLPFQEMSNYPYGVNESYPNDEEHQNYMSEWNTRNISLSQSGGSLPNGYNNTVFDNTIIGGNIGISLDGEEASAILNNAISDVGIGIVVGLSTGMLIDGNNISSEYNTLDIEGSSNNNITNNILNSSSDSSSNAVIYLMDFGGESISNIFLGNTIIGDYWVYDQYGENIFNDSTSGNRYYLANGTPSWEIYNLVDDNEDGWADSGDVPFNSNSSLKFGIVEDSNHLEASTGGWTDAYLGFDGDWSTSTTLSESYGYMNFNAAVTGVQSYMISVGTGIGIFNFTFSDECLLEYEGFSLYAYGGDSPNMTLTCLDKYSNEQVIGVIPGTVEMNESMLYYSYYTQPIWRQFGADGHPAISAGESYSGCVDLSDSSTWQGKIVNNSGTLNVNQDITLCTNDYPAYSESNDAFINITSSDITIDCNGAKITSEGSEYGIFAESVNGIQIKNCIISNFNYGILFVNVSDSSIKYNNFTYNWFSAGLVSLESEGILYGSNNNEITYNNFTENLYGFFLDYSNNNRIGNNYLYSIYISNLGDNSCPYIYSWNGTGYNFDSEDLAISSMSFWKSDYHARLPSLVSDNGKYKLKVTEELDETDYFDKLQLAAVDHPLGTEVYNDLEGNHHTIRNLTNPISCVNEYGEDCMKYVDGSGNRWNEERDMRKNVKDADNDGYSDSTNETDFSTWIDVTFKKEGNNAKLLWDPKIKTGGYATYSWLTYLNMVGSNNQNVLEEWNNNGLMFSMMQDIVDTMYLWNGTDWNYVHFGVEMFAEHKAPEIVIPIDLSGIEGETFTIRVKSIQSVGGPSFIKADFSEDESVNETIVNATSAECYSNGEVYDGKDKFASTDNDSVVLNKGDSCFVEFPSVAENGEARTYFTKSNGYYNSEMDIKEVNMTSEKKSFLESLWVDPLTDRRYFAPKVFAQMSRNGPTFGGALPNSINNTVYDNQFVYANIALALTNETGTTVVGNNFSEVVTGIGLVDSQGNNLTRNIINSSLYSITFANSVGNIITRNNLTSDNWINDSSGGNYYNDSSFGNIYYLANGTPSWDAFSLSDTNGDGWADSGDVPFNSSIGIINNTCNQGATSSNCSTNTYNANINSGWIDNSLVGDGDWNTGSAPSSEEIAIYNVQYGYLNEPFDYESVQAGYARAKIHVATNEENEMLDLDISCYSEGIGIRYSSDITNNQINVSCGELLIGQLNGATLNEQELIWTYGFPMWLGSGEDWHPWAGSVSSVANQEPVVEEIPSSGAVNTYYSDSNLPTSGNSFQMSVNDQVKFIVEVENHTLTLNSFNDSIARVTLQSTPIVVYLEKGKLYQFDVSGDGKNDVIIKYNGVVNGKAKIFIQEIVEQGKGDIVSYSPEVYDKSNGGIIWSVLIVAGLIVAGYLFYRKKRYYHRGY